MLKLEALSLAQLEYLVINMSYLIGGFTSIQLSYQYYWKSRFILGFHYQHKSDNSGIFVQNWGFFEKFQQKVKMPPVGNEVTTVTITWLED